MDHRIVKALLILYGCGPTCPTAPLSARQGWPGLDPEEPWLEHLNRHVEKMPTWTWDRVR